MRPDLPVALDTPSAAPPPPPGGRDRGRENRSSLSLWGPAGNLGTADGPEPEVAGDREASDSPAAPRVEEMRHAHGARLEGEPSSRSGPAYGRGGGGAGDS